MPQNDESVSTPLPDSDLRVLADFRSALRKFVAVSEASARKSGLTPQRYQALITIRIEGGDQGLSVGGLAERMLIKPHSAAELANRLELIGLVVRNSDPEDRRRVLLKLTEKGESRLAGASKIQFAELEQHRHALESLLETLRRGA